MPGLEPLDEMRLKAMTRIVKAAHSKKIDTFVSVGASAKPIALLFRHLWKKLYPREPVPKMASLGNLVKKTTPSFLQNPNSAKILLEQRPNLKKQLNGRIMLFDELALSGETIKLARKMFLALGAKNITTALLFSEKRFFFLEPGTGKVRPAKLADVIGSVHKLKTAEMASYYKQRALFGLGLEKARRMNSLKRQRKRAKQTRQHLKQLARNKK